MVLTDQAAAVAAASALGAASASAFTLVDRRLLSRAALFLWKMPLSATMSTTACILPNSSVALAGDKAKATALFGKMQTVVDTVADKGIFHKNKAARDKSRLSTKVKALALATA